MARYVLFGDLHVYKHLSRTVFEDTAVQFIYDIANYCSSNKIDNIIFLGDFFHVKSKIYVPAYIRSMEALEYIKKLGIKIHFIIGNHDMPLLNSTEFSIIHSFSPFGCVVKDYEWFDIGNDRLHFLSYTNELPEFEYKNDGKNILFGHLDILDFSMDGIICREGFNKTDFKKFDQVFSGHFHKHQSIGNICYVGSPYQTRYSERFDDKGFIEYDTEKSWKFNIYSKAPKFKEIDISEFDTKDVAGNFIRIKTHKDNTDLNSIKQTIIDAGAQTVDFIFEKEENDGELNIIEDLSMGSLDQLASDYFDNVKENSLFDSSIQELLDADELSKEDFIKIFNDIKDADLTGWKPEDEDKELLTI
jgi:DNA repair exonuclease SbcCD nuclease subunit